MEKHSIVVNRPLCPFGNGEALLWTDPCDYLKRKTNFINCADQRLKAIVDVNGLNSIPKLTFLIFSYKSKRSKELSFDIFSLKKIDTKNLVKTFGHQAKQT